jgi:aminoglycoside phosphotransferase (APT) family kinase protein
VAVPKIHDDEVPVDDALVRTLVDDQQPQWADRPLRRVPSAGTDNAIYRLGDELAVRLPRIHWAVPQIGKEHEWLPVLAPHLPVAVPEPVALGEPTADYPYPWLVYRWLPGDDALAGPAPDWEQVAVEVAAFVAALQAVDADAGPPPGSRIGSLAPNDEDVRRLVTQLDGQLDADRALAVWGDALAADPWPGPPVWAHGDLAVGNLVLRDGRLAGVIDWSAAGIGDPACDVMIVWSWPPAARAAYREALGVDDATWARARGWTIEQAVRFIPYYEHTIPTGVAHARHRLANLLAREA